MVEPEAIWLATKQAVAAADPRTFLAENVKHFHAGVARCPNALLREGAAAPVVAAGGGRRG